MSICPELECIAQDLGGLQSIRLNNCYKLESVTRGLDGLDHLQEIEIQWCPKLVHYEVSGLPPTTNLRSLTIDRCEKFGALPNCINSFTSLQKLVLAGCSIDISYPQNGFPTNLKSLHIAYASKISRALIERELDRLTSLQTLFINGEGCSDMVSFPKKEMMLPASLNHITIASFENLEFMCSTGFQNLTSFQSLKIRNCPKLVALPKKDMLLSLLCLRIYYSPLLEEEYKKGTGRKWSEIAHVPLVHIRG